MFVNVACGLTTRCGGKGAIEHASFAVQPRRVDHPSAGEVTANGTRYRDVGLTPILNVKRDLIDKDLAAEIDEPYR